MISLYSVSVRSRWTVSTARGNRLISRRDVVKPLAASSAAVLGLGSHAIAELLTPVAVTRYRLQPAGWHAGRA